MGGTSALLCAGRVQALRCVCVCRECAVVSTFGFPRMGWSARVQFTDGLVNTCAIHGWAGQHVCNSRMGWSTRVQLTDGLVNAWAVHKSFWPGMASGLFSPRARRLGRTYS